MSPWSDSFETVTFSSLTPASRCLLFTSIAFRYAEKQRQHSNTYIISFLFSFWMLNLPRDDYVSSPVAVFFIIPHQHVQLPEADLLAINITSWFYYYFYIQLYANTRCFVVLDRYRVTANLFKSAALSSVSLIFIIFNIFACVHEIRGAYLCRLRDSKSQPMVSTFLNIVYFSYI